MRIDTLVPSQSGLLPSLKAGKDYELTKKFHLGQLSKVMTPMENPW